MAMVGNVSDEVNHFKGKMRKLQSMLSSMKSLCNPKRDCSLDSTCLGVPGYVEGRGVGHCSTELKSDDLCQQVLQP